MMLGMISGRTRLVRGYRRKWFVEIPAESVDKIDVHAELEVSFVSDPDGSWAIAIAPADDGPLDRMER
jgi:hypothetical protein